MELPKKPRLQDQSANNSYHEKLKTIGHDFKVKKKLPQCRREVNIENMTLPTMLNCEWDKCSELIKNYENFLHHVGMHLEQYPHIKNVEGGIKCKWLNCEKKFQNIYKLKEHLRSHTKEKTVACPDCGSMFSTMSKFKEHCERQIPPEELTFLCSMCNKYYATETILKDHMKNHIHSIKCNFCEISCTSSSTLATHIRYRHLNEKPFRCQSCDYSCKTKQDLKSHMSTHSNELMFRCKIEECDFECKSDNVLNRHVAEVHKNEKKWYSCHECEAKFLNKSKLLSQHLIQEHKISMKIGHKRFQFKKDEDGCYRLNNDKEVASTSDEVIHLNNTSKKNTL
ncbi:histone H4 transcription factor-like [Leptopilina heterotoma]|uniref:histone H4 transcription factor-like n=1 Tax=Leptopilina heterotoma TaxID=63436 RepID=UPI001CA9B417|nr:histone H4 transcription factor-like [Leptopilina heterotoma]